MTETTSDESPPYGGSARSLESGLAGKTPLLPHHHLWAPTWRCNNLLWGLIFSGCLPFWQILYYIIFGGQRTNQGAVENYVERWARGETYTVLWWKYFDIITFFIEIYITPGSKQFPLSTPLPLDLLVIAWSTMSQQVQLGTFISASFSFRSLVDYTFALSEKCLLVMDVCNTLFHNQNPTSVFNTTLLH